MKALIFNSGLGKRMGEFTHNNHKSMAVLQNGETIFERQLRVLKECGIREFIITTGPFKEQLVSICSKPHFSGLEIKMVENPIYDKTNYIYSMYLARRYFDDDMLFLHGDLVFNKGIIDKILNSAGKDLGMVDKQRRLPEKDFKARLEGEFIREVSINVFDEDCCAFQPLYKLSLSSVKAWTRKVEEYVEAGNDKVYAENALNEIIAELKIKAFSYHEDFVDEVDNLDDLQRVSSEIRQFDFDEQPIYSGKDSYKKAIGIIKENQVKAPLIVGGSGFQNSILHKYLEENGVSYILFNGYSPNPSYDEVSQGTEIFRKNKCDFIISVGGGSAIDTAKNIKLFSELDSKKIYMEQDYVYSPVKHLAIPATAGTGSECTRFSVLYYKGEKQSIAHDSIVPDYVILEPSLLCTLSLYQKKCTLMDALCQCIEAVWSVNSNDKCREYAAKGARLILEHWKEYLEDSGNSYEVILEAAALSGKAINISQTTAAHAMSYKISSLYGLPHGHAVALCMVSVWKFINNNKENKNAVNVDKSLGIINNIFGSDRTADSINKFRDILEQLELGKPDHATEDEIEILTASVNPVRLKNNPVQISQKEMKELYLEILS